MASWNNSLCELSMACNRHLRIETHLLTHHQVASGTPGQAQGRWPLRLAGLHSSPAHHWWFLPQPQGSPRPSPSLLSGLKPLSIGELPAVVCHLPHLLSSRAFLCPAAQHGVAHPWCLHRHLLHHLLQFHRGGSNSPCWVVYAHHDGSPWHCLVLVDT